MLKALILCKEHLLKYSEMVELLNNRTHVRYLRTLNVIEKQQQIHKRRKYQSKPSKSNGIYYIDIPIDSTIAWNEIPKQLEVQYWKIIKDPKKIEKIIISRNKEHSHQIHGTTCIIDPIAPLLTTIFLQNSVLTCYWGHQIS